ncbi:hypothetical protein ED28_15565 [[Pantoea] beijingensis]|uniref:Uncharacterized protein n=1 Tax=[Pantoea] beijingensis TaxID=1324864 RepID=A0A443I9T8_9GAMM|nr:hypothetical protein ED28_15565 [[Pantoea] beijingensis]
MLPAENPKVKPDLNVKEWIRQGYYIEAGKVHSQVIKVVIKDEDKANTLPSDDTVFSTRHDRG